MFAIEWPLKAQLENARSMGNGGSSTSFSNLGRDYRTRTPFGIGPLYEGEGRLGDVRVAFEWPIGISFTVDTRAQLVTLDHVWLIR